MLTKVFQSVFGSERDRQIKRLVPLVREVASFERTMVRMTNDELRAQTGKFKEMLSQGSDLDSILPEVYATCREAAKRVCGMRHFDVQIMGGINLHQGKIAEMMTGEGKTLVATLPVYLNGLTGQGVHVVTVNDYLARRDKEWMGPIYEFLGLTTGLIQHDMTHLERQASYRADITYATNNELGFDYLRDNMAHHPSMLVQRPLNYAIVDEIDSILIDEARTPLIISGRPEKSTDLYLSVAEAVKRMLAEQKEIDHRFQDEEKHEEESLYKLEEKGHHVLLSDKGMARAEELLGIDNLYTEDSLGIVHMFEQSLKAHNFYKRDQEYVVRDGQVLIVDEFTGRIQEGRRFSDGLHQALEAKEGVKVQFELQTIASITYQNYFKLYNKLAGMTGTALTEAQEFMKIYDLEVMQMPTNLPLRRDDMNDLIYATERGKLNGLVTHIHELHESGRPVLVGTRSIEMSERIGKLLEEAGVDDFEILNAKYHSREASIVGSAGKRGSITIATNMAGRGTDIKLGEGVRELGGLAILGTERHESRRIDNQLRGRCGRQGDPGSTQFFLSLEDEAARLFGGDRVKRVLTFFGSQDEMDEIPLEQRMVSRSIERAQRTWEEHNFEIRKHVKEYDDVMNAQRKIIYEIRREVLENKDVRERIISFMENQIADACNEFAPEEELPDNWDLEGLETSFRSVFGFVPRVEAEEDEDPQSLPEDLLNQAITEYERREGIVADLLRDSYREQVGSDDSGVDFAQLARKRVHDWEKMALLRAVDDKWIEHLYTMDYLRDSVRLRAYGQRDPLLEYKNEGFNAFEHMIRSVEENTLQTLFRITDPETSLSRDPQKRIEQQSDPFAGLHQYHMVQMQEHDDQSFAAADTSRFKLAGNRTAEEAPTGDGKATALVEGAEDKAPKGNRAQRRAAEKRAKKNKKKRG